MSITINRLSPALGAEFGGIDLREPVDPSTKSTILNAWLEHLVLIVRYQDLDDACHIRFCEIFGDVQPERTNPQLPGSNIPAVHFASNMRDDGILPHGDIVFHMDQINHQRPSQAMSLYGMDVPSSGGETKFLNSHMTYDTLPNNLKKRITKLHAENAYQYYSPNMMRKVTEREPKAPRAIHPVVRTHPVTGRKAIYVNRLLSDRILELAPKKGNELLQLLFDHMEKDQFIYELHWRKGDVILWDNRSVLHARNTYDSKNERRQLRRIAILGDVPY